MNREAGDPVDPDDAKGGTHASRHARDEDTTLDKVGHRIVSAGAAAGRLIASAREIRVGDRELARLRKAARSPLPNLYELHPAARVAPRRPLGLKTIPVAEILGTAVEGPAQRGGDFLPLPQLRGRNWGARWQRLLQAHERLVILPPIEVVQAAGGYWVVDGHNRVAAALYGGQDDIDASVTHVHLAGDAAEPRTGSLAAGLADAAELRAAGEGRLTRGASLRRSGRPADRGR